jgi:hypothetical protein
MCVEHKGGEPDAAIGGPTSSPRRLRLVPAVKPGRKNLLGSGGSDPVHPGDNRADAVIELAGESVFVGFVADVVDELSGKLEVAFGLGDDGEIELGHRVVGGREEGRLAGRARTSLVSFGEEVTREMVGDVDDGADHVVVDVEVG